MRKVGIGLKTDLLHDIFSNGMIIGHSQGRSIQAVEMLLYKLHKDFLTSTLVMRTAHENIPFSRVLVNAPFDAADL